MRPKIVTAKKNFGTDFFEPRLKFERRNFFIPTIYGRVARLQSWPLEPFGPHFWPFGGRIFGRKTAKNGPIWSIRNLGPLTMTPQGQNTFDLSIRSPNKKVDFFGWGRVSSSCDTQKNNCLVLYQECSAVQAAGCRGLENPKFELRIWLQETHFEDEWSQFFFFFFFF